MKAIVAVDQNWGIGYDGKLLKKIPEDMNFFKQMTLGKVVVMGMRTFESLPDKKPLKDRVNIVLSSNYKTYEMYTYEATKLMFCSSINDLIIRLKQYCTNDVFIIGGDTIYKQLLPFCNEAYVTKINKEYIADRHFINLDQEKLWKLVYESELKSYYDTITCEKISYRFLKYQIV